MNNNTVKFAVTIVLIRTFRNLLSGIVPPLIPILAIALDEPLWILGLLVTVFSLGSGIGQAPVGYLSDKLDRRYILVPGLATAGLSYLLFAMAPFIGTAMPITLYGQFDTTLMVMLFSMIICGLATSVVHPTIYPMITKNTQKKNKGKILALYGSAGKFGNGTGPLIIGLLIIVFVWEITVAIIGVVSVFFSVVLFFLLRDFDTGPVKNSSTDSDNGQNKETVWEADKREYVYPMFIIYFFFVTRGFATRGLTTFIPAFIVGVYGYTFSIGYIALNPESLANIYFSVVLLCGAAAQILVGIFLDRTNVTPPLILIAFMCAATAGIIVLAFLQLSPFWLMSILILIGTTIWGLNPARDLLISQITPEIREGRTFGYLWTAQHLTGAFIPAFIGYIADQYGLRQSFAILSIGGILAIVSISLLYSDRFYKVTSRTSTAD